MGERPIELRGDEPLWEYLMKKRILLARQEGVTRIQTFGNTVTHDSDGGTRIGHQYFGDQGLD